MKLAPPKLPGTWKERVNPDGSRTVQVRSRERGWGMPAASAGGYLMALCLYGCSGLPWELGNWGWLVVFLLTVAWVYQTLWLVADTEEWQVAEARLEVRSSLFGISGVRRRWTEGELQVSGPIDKRWVVYLRHERQRHPLLESASLGETLGLAAYLETHTGWEAVYPCSVPALFSGVLHLASAAPGPAHWRLLFEQPALLPGFAEAVRGSRWRDSILTALRRLEGEHARLREALTGEDLPLRAAALELLAELEDRSALPYARSLLASGDVELRLQAVNALGKLHDQESVSVLLELLTVPGELQGAAAVALGRIGDRRATAALCALLRPDARGPNIQAEVAEALGHLGDPEAIPVLSEALTAPHAAVRAAAAQSLGKLGDASSIPPLCQGLYDEETSVRQAAATALGMIAERSPTAPIQLRAAIPILRRLGSNLSPDGPAVRPTYREVLRQIEARTASIKELPLPASPAAANADSLPRVSSSGE